ncbi:hypothetical protein [Piscinibacter sp. XHJ-5]|uniref:hypothetical protein n=1 Tax=Piscinibacter sp. XHJ-5 TaxID=3037797 RepID=UPI002452E426|nr:hypothetical protein [Piscinibacter sp. XHJ-5]
MSTSNLPFVPLTAPACPIQTSRFERPFPAMRTGDSCDGATSRSGRGRGRGGRAWLEAEAYELRFRELVDTTRGYSFPCDAMGHVDLDALGERDRNDYFYARALIGRDLSTPVVQRVSPHDGHDPSGNHLDCSDERAVGFGFAQNRRHASTGA